MMMMVYRILNNIFWENKNENCLKKAKTAAIKKFTVSWTFAYLNFFF